MSDANRRRLAREVRERAPEGPGVYLLRGQEDEVLYVGKAIHLRCRLLSHLTDAAGSAGRRDRDRRAGPPRTGPREPASFRSARAVERGGGASGPGRRPGFETVRAHGERFARPTPDLRHCRLVHAIRSFDWESAPSELLALLREDELIKRHRPPYNVRQNDFDEYAYLSFTSGVYPRLVAIAPGGAVAGGAAGAAIGSRRDSLDNFDRGGGLHGPYRDRFMAVRLADLLRRTLGIRSCSDPHPRGRCPRFDLGQCLGPCRGRSSVEEYGRAVATARSFLRGDDAAVSTLLEAAMAAAAGRLEFERAQELKEQAAFCRRFGERARFLRAFREGALLVVDEAAGFGYLFDRGRLTAFGPEVGGSPVAPAAPSVGRDRRREVERDAGREAGADEDPRFVFDRSVIVHGWLSRRAGRCRHAFLPEE